MWYGSASDAHWVTMTWQLPVPPLRKLRWTSLTALNSLRWVRLIVPCGTTEEINKASYRARHSHSAQAPQHFRLVRHRGLGTLTEPKLLNTFDRSDRACQRILRACKRASQFAFMPVCRRVSSVEGRTLLFSLPAGAPGLPSVTVCR